MIPDCATQRPRARQLRSSTTRPTFLICRWSYASTSTASASQDYTISLATRDSKFGPTGTADRTPAGRATDVVGAASAKSANGGIIASSSSQRASSSKQRPLKPSTRTSSCASNSWTTWEPVRSPGASIRTSCATRLDLQIRVNMYHRGDCISLPRIVELRWKIYLWLKQLFQLICRLWFIPSERLMMSLTSLSLAHVSEDNNGYAIASQAIRALDNTCGVHQKLSSV